MGCREHGTLGDTPCIVMWGGGRWRVVARTCVAQLRCVLRLPGAASASVLGALASAGACGLSGGGDVAWLAIWQRVMSDQVAHGRLSRIWVVALAEGGPSPRPACNTDRLTGANGSPQLPRQGTAQGSALRTVPYRREWLCGPNAAYRTVHTAYFCHRCCSGMPSRERRSRTCVLHVIGT